MAGWHLLFILVLPGMTGPSHKLAICHWEYSPYPQYGAVLHLFLLEKPAISLLILRGVTADNRPARPAHLAARPRLGLPQSGDPGRRAWLRAD
jgi:hypothetical protein